MNTASLLTTKSFLKKNWIWFLIVIFFAPITSKTITDGKWIYAGIILLSPFLLYLCIHKPFVFPFGLYVFSLPLESLFVLTGAEKGPTLTRLLGALSIVALLLNGYFQKKFKKPDSLNIWWVLFVFYGLLSVFWAINQNVILLRLSTVVGLLALYIVLSSYKITKEEYDLLKWLIFFAGLLAALGLIYNYKLLLAAGSAGRASIAFLDHTAKSNSLAFNLLFSVSICISIMLGQKKKIMTLLFFFILILFFFAIIVTGSRGGLLAALIISLFYIMGIKKKTRYIVLIIIAVLIIIPLIPDFFMERVEKSVETHADSRFDIWYVGYKALSKYWLFGAGLDNFGNAYTEFIGYAPSFIGYGRAPHNIFLGFFVELGIIGISLLIITLLKHYQAIAKPKNTSEQIMLKAAFWGMMVSSLSMDIVWNKFFWLLFMMIVMQKHITNKKYHVFAGNAW